MKHEVVSVEKLTWPKTGLLTGLIKVECSCGYWQQIRSLAYTESLWVKAHEGYILR